MENKVTTDELNTHLLDIIAEAKKVFAHEDVSRAHSSEYMSHTVTDSLLSLVAGKSFSFYVTTYQNNGSYLQFDRDGDLVIGVAFPENEPGDEVKFQANTHTMWSLTIEDPNKFYLPVCGQFPLPLILAGQTELGVKNKQPKDATTMCVVYVHLDTPMRRAIVTSFIHYKFPGSSYYANNRFMGWFVTAPKNYDDSIVFEGEKRDGWKIYAINDQGNLERADN